MKLVRQTYLRRGNESEPFEAPFEYAPDRTMGDYIVDVRWDEETVAVTWLVPDAGRLDA